MAKTIKIKRSGEVFQSEREAIAFLSRTPHQPGQLIMVRYWASETETDAILALGIRASIGPDAYSIVSVGGVKVVSGIISSDSELPDASMLVNGETWIYQEPVTHDLYWIYLYEESRDVIPIDPEINYRVFCLSDNSEYWLYGGNLEKANNYYSRDAIDRKIGEINSRITQVSSDLSETITTGFQGISETLGTDSGYPGTIPGASNFDDADRILQSRIAQAAQSVQGLSNRVSDIEKELLSNSEGLSPTTRLDTLYSWYDEVTHTPKGIVKFIEPETPVIQGSPVTVKVVYHWSWADRGSWSGLVLENELKPFGLNDVADANIPDGTYEWNAEVTVGSDPITLEASFGGSDLEPVTYVLEPEPIEREITISWPVQGWNAHQYTYVVNFKGTGLPVLWAGNELSVTQGSTKVFQATEGQGPSQNTTYTGVLSSDAQVRALWNTISEEANFQATYLIVLPKNTEVTTESLEDSEETWKSYLRVAEFETPDITYEPDQTLVILSPYTLEGLEILCLPVGSELLTVTSDFTAPDTIQYHGTTYNYISFPRIGAGTFKFIIS